MDILDYSSTDIKNGYIFNKENKSFTCLVCQETFTIGEVYKFEDHYYDASTYIKIHLKSKHVNYLNDLIDSESKYNSLTKIQRNILCDFGCGYPDNEIAKKNNNSVSTIRHQRYSFKEKAKQAKLYLAIYESVFEQD